VVSTDKGSGDDVSVLAMGGTYTYKEYVAEPDVVFPYWSGGLVTTTVQLYVIPGLNDPGAIPSTCDDKDVTYVGGLVLPAPIVH